ncbi:MAG: RnfH family protein [Pseudomonadales bacterium]|nr:RnfH family protein [Pseudomonadales bacterium]MBO6564045.1 RnfH family protein [Pseudomonadales bacterium]MBO6597442.1 RnfH family protein [Pseudomonadales bacterium]MBO6824176.1 RnfH family protein [Pseudomonadales bacterium]
MSDTAQLKVTVAYVTPNQQELIELTLPRGASINDAIALADIQTKHPNVDFASLEKGIWYEKKPGTTVLKDGDRVEIYRPLIADAKEARRRRAERRRND